MKDPVITTTLVTPQMAKSWLDSSNTRNRPLRNKTLYAYASDMRSGRWQQNGECIKFDRNGVLLDGQHRLAAISQSGVSIPLVIVRGLDPESFHTIDTGMRRSAAHMLTISGVPNAGQAGAICRWVEILSVGDLSTSSTVSSERIMQVLHEHPFIVEIASSFAVKGIRGLLPSACGAVFVLGAEKYGMDLMKSFLSDFLSGENLKKGDPVYELRERMIASKSKIARLNTEVAVAMTIKAVSAFVTGRPIFLLRWSPTQQFPVL